MLWKLRDVGLGALLGAVGLGLLLWPGDVMEAGREALALCGNIILPSLFPFFVLSSMTVGLGLADFSGRLLQRVMLPLFRLNGNCSAALVLGLIGGYPVGARTAAELYEKGLCSKAEAERMLGFCNNSGPAFLLGVVGSGVFGSIRVGVLLLCIHILSALLVGLLFRFYPGGSAPQHRPEQILSQNSVHPAQVFTGAVTSSLASILNVCAFILLFGVLLRLLEKCGLLGWCAGLLSPLGLDQVWWERILKGMLELSNGVACLPSNTPGLSIPLAAFLLGWGGVSVLCQTMSVIQNSSLSIKTCVAGKLAHGLISALLAAAALQLFPGTIPVSALLPDALSNGAKPGFAGILLGSTALAALLFALLLYLNVEKEKNRGGNRRKGKL